MDTKFLGMPWGALGNIQLTANHRVTTVLAQLAFAPVIHMR